MYMVSKKIILTLLIHLMFTTLSWANDFPVEIDTTLRALKYGEGCTNCTENLSVNYCSPLCCSDCQNGVINRQGLRISDACDGICGLNQSKSENDKTLLNSCAQSNYAGSNCDDVEPFKNVVATSYDFNRRLDSCYIHADESKKNCSEAKLNSIYPRELFELAEQINSSETCDLEEVEKFRVKSQSNDPQEELALCEKNLSLCKTFCYDQNVVYEPERQENTDGQKLYETVCQPLNDKKKVREEVIMQANDTVMTCQANNSEGATGSENSESKNKSKTADDPTKIANNPAVALSRFNEIVSMFAPFLPTGGGGGYLNNEIARSAPPPPKNHSLTDLEKYGADYGGYDPSDADDLDYSTPNPFDQPKNLQPKSNANPSRGGSMGGGAGMLGQNQRGGARSGSAPNRGANGPGRKLQKDKTLFGKTLTGSGPSGYPSGGTGSSARSRQGLGRAYVGPNGKLVREFNASKYHQAILASYDKGLKSKAHQQAQRRAAGLLPEDSNSRSSRGYTSWHLENRIHPETISLFMQTKLCYFTKFRSDFTKTCASNP